MANVKQVARVTLISPRVAEQRDIQGLLYLFDFFVDGNMILDCVMILFL